MFLLHLYSFSEKCFLFPKKKEKCFLWPLYQTVTYQTGPMTPLIRWQMYVTTPRKNGMSCSHTQHCRSIGSSRDCVPSSAPFNIAAYMYKIHTWHVFILLSEKLKISIAKSEQLKHIFWPQNISKWKSIIVKFIFISNFISDGHKFFRGRLFLEEGHYHPPRKINF